MSYKVQRLLPRHTKILKMVLSGYDRKQISEITGSSLWQVTAVMRSPLFQAELARGKREGTHNDLELERSAEVGKARSVLQQTREILDKAAPEAAETLRNLLNNGSSGIKLQSAKTVLDRVFASEDGPTSGRININITTEDSALLILALKESNHARNVIQEVQHPDGNPANSPPDRRQDVLEARENSPSDAGPRGSDDLDPQPQPSLEGASGIVDG